MERIRSQDLAEIVGVAMGLIPPVMRERVGPVHHFEGDLHLAGAFKPKSRERWIAENLHGNTDHEGNAAAVRAMCAPMRHAPRDQRVSTISYLSRSMIRPAQVLHEYAHAIQFWVHWGIDRWDELPRCCGGFNFRPGIPGADSWKEQAAEAFVCWLLPPELYTQRWDHDYEPGRRAFYDARPDLGPDYDNRHLLAFYNEIAGFPADAPPPSMRGT